MAFTNVERRDIALKLESSRGTAETAPDKYLKASRDSGFQFDTELVENDNIQNQVAGEWAAEAGAQLATGKITADLEAQTIGELFNSLMGAVASVQDGATTAYTHTFTKTTSTQHPAYTFFIDRGIDHYRYQMGIVKRVEISVDVKGRGQVTAEILAQTESTADAYAPTIVASDPLMFHHVDIELDDVSIKSRVGKFNIAFDNQAEPLFVFNQQRYASDIVCSKKLLIEGGYDLYFTDKTERDLFLAGTAAKMEFNVVGDTIIDTFNYRVLSTLYGAKFTAVPWDGELEGGFMGASVAFKGFYSVGSSKAADIVIGNTTTTYS